ncbi:MAG TPA: flagellar hook capping FlgD N-terminal domain-containing protein [Rhodoferax sp.]
MLTSTNSATVSSAQTTGTSTTGSSTSTSSSSAASQQDRFMKLLVAQLNNQDPMNPMDNAQMTSQIAQINTVSGIQQVNDTLTAMTAQLNAMQVMQGSSSLVGKNVMIDSDTLTVSNGVASGGMDLAANAESVKVDILSPGGQVIDTLNLGALDAGRHTFDWDASKYNYSGQPSFKITATTGGQTIGSTALASDKVTSVGSSNGAMTVQLQGHGSVAYGDIQSIL